MSIVSIILIALLVILLFIISAALILLGLYLGYQGILWIMENFQVLSAYIQ